jgi:hypothetical protein
MSTFGMSELIGTARAHANQTVKPMPLVPKDLLGASLGSETRNQVEPRVPSIKLTFYLPTDHLLLDSAPNLGQLISRWEIYKFENC